MRLLILLLCSGAWSTWAADSMQHHHHNHHQTTPPLASDLRDPFAWSAPDATPSHAHESMPDHAIQVHQLEWAKPAEQLQLHASAWIGDDDRRIVLRSEIERQSAHQTDQLWSVHMWRPLDPFWNVEAGLAWEDRADAANSQTWLSVGLTGLAPYWVDTGIGLLVDRQGYSKLQLSAAYDLRITQDWLLTPDISLIAYGRDRPTQHEWAGLAHLKTGLRLGYQRQRLLIPYVGLTYQQDLGNTAKQRTDTTDAVQGVLGIRFWY